MRRLLKMYRKTIYSRYKSVHGFMYWEIRRKINNQVVLHGIDRKVLTGQRLEFNSSTEGISYVPEFDYQLSKGQRNV